jgi:hypothetical protein
MALIGIVVKSLLNASVVKPCATACGGAVELPEVGVTVTFNVAEGLAAWASPIESAKKAADKKDFIVASLQRSRQSSASLRRKTLEHVSRS